MTHSPNELSTMCAGSPDPCGRRDFLVKIAAGAIMLGVSVHAGATRAAHATPKEDLGSPFRQVLPGIAIHGEWLVDAVQRDTDAVVVTLKHGGGQLARIDICRLDEATGPRGVVHTRLFDLIVMNGGAGTRKTPDGLERALRVLGAVLRRDEGSLATAPPWLATFAERHARFDRGDLRFRAS